MKDYLEVILAIEDIKQIERLSSILGSFDKIGKLTTAPSMSALRPHIDKKFSGFLFIIDLTCNEFKSLHSKIETILADKNNQVLFLHDDKLSYQISDDKEMNFIKYEFKLIDLLSKVSLILEAKPISYFPIGLTNFYKKEVFPCDIYVRIGSTKFIRVALENEKTDMELINKYKTKNINKFFVQENDFFDKCQDLFGEGLVSKKIFDSKEDYLKKSHEVLHEMVLSLGVSKFVVEQIDESIAELESDLKKSKLGAILELFKKSKGTFIYDHSFLTLSFSRILCKHMDWQSEEIRKKLSQACMLHDLAHENSKDALLESSDMLKIKTMAKESQDKLFGHPEKIAKMLEKNKDISQEVINLVLHHHEGLGAEDSYPKGLTGVQLTQLDCVFIISHALVIEMYKTAFNPNKFKKNIEEIKGTYTTGHFKSVLKALDIFAKEDLKISN